MKNIFQQVYCLYSFNKDEIDWAGTSRVGFFKTLIDLKHNNKALWNGRNGGFIQKISTGHDDKVYAFMREKEGDKVVGIFNMKNVAVNINLEGSAFIGDYKNVFTNEKHPLSIGTNFLLKPYEFYVLSNK